jgi:predicted dehydrogenase
MPVRVGVIGAGFAGTMHARSLLGLDGVTVVAIAEATPGSAVTKRAVGIAELPA